MSGPGRGEGWGDTCRGPPAPARAWPGTRGGGTPGGGRPGRVPSPGGNQGRAGENAEPQAAPRPANQSPWGWDLGGAFLAAGEPGRRGGACGVFPGLPRGSAAAGGRSWVGPAEQVSVSWGAMPAAILWALCAWLPGGLGSQARLRLYRVGNGNGRPWGWGRGWEGAGTRLPHFLRRAFLRGALRV